VFSRTQAIEVVSAINRRARPDARLDRPHEQPAGARPAPSSSAARSGARGRGDGAPTSPRPSRLCRALASSHRRGTAPRPRVAAKALASRRARRAGALGAGRGLTWPSGHVFQRHHGGRGPLRVPAFDRVRLRVGTVQHNVTALARAVVVPDVIRPSGCGGLWRRSAQLTPVPGSKEEYYPPTSSGRERARRAGPCTRANRSAVVRTPPSVSLYHPSRTNSSAPVLRRLREPAPRWWSSRARRSSAPNWPASPASSCPGAPSTPSPGRLRRRRGVRRGDDEPRGRRPGHARVHGFRGPPARWTSDCWRGAAAAPADPGGARGHQADEASPGAGAPRPGAVSPGCCAPRPAGSEPPCKRPSCVPKRQAPRIPACADALPGDQPRPPHSRCSSWWTGAGRSLLPGLPPGRRLCPDATAAAGDHDSCPW